MKNILILTTFIGGWSIKYSDEALAVFSEAAEDDSVDTEAICLLIRAYNGEQVSFRTTYDASFYSYVILMPQEASDGWGQYDG